MCLLGVYNMTTQYAVTCRDNVLTMQELHKDKEDILVQTANVVKLFDVRCVFNNHYDAWQNFRYLKRLFS
jgi:hypothetical protein